MKYFVAVEEDLLQRLWMQDPALVVPFSRPFYPSELRACSLELNLSEQVLTLSSPDNDEPAPQLSLPGIQTHSEVSDNES